MSFHQVLLHYWALQGLPSSNSLWPHGAHFLHSPPVAEDDHSCLPHLCRALEKQSQWELHAGKAELQAAPVCEQAAAAAAGEALPSASRHLCSAQSHGMTRCVGGFE